jgi:hypothetical protein
MITGLGAQLHGIIITAFYGGDGLSSSFILFISGENPQSTNNIEE